MDVKVNDDLMVHNFIVTRLYKGSTLFINYNYTDKSVGEEIKKMLRESKFKNDVKHITTGLAIGWQTEVQ